MNDFKVGVNVDVPSVPNFIRIKTRIDPKAGFDSSVSVADLTDEELRQIGEKWIEKLIDNAKKLRVLR